MNISRLDHLPVELFHHVFNYLSAHDIFYGFSHLTSYIDAILRAYTKYRLNFKAISSNHFINVCRYIVPDHVIALTLSDDKDTPGLIDAFLSRFQLNQFTRLQAFQLIEISPTCCENIMIHLTTLKHLRYFHYYLSNQTGLWMSNISADRLEQIDQSLFDTYTPILSQLYQLKLHHGDFLSSISFPHLRRLILDRSTTELIEHISTAAPQLHILETSLPYNSLSTGLIPVMSRLNRLILQIWDLAVPMNLFEQMMSNLPLLRHLELISNCDYDVIDGHRWQTIAQNLLTFKFMFYISHKLGSHRLNSFRSRFWINEKRWYVAYRLGRFYSVPHFTPTEADDDFRLPWYTTVPNDEIFYKCIKKLNLNKALSRRKAYFPHVETLELSFVPFLSIIKTTIDCHQVHHLVLNSVEKIFLLQSLINEMPNLYKISIYNDVKVFIEHVHHRRFNQIRTLHIGDSSTDITDFKIEDLCVVFPYLNHLHVNYQYSMETVCYVLRELKYLSTASFDCMHWFDDANSDEDYVCIQSMFDQIRCIYGLNCTYRFNSSMIYFWILPQSSQRPIQAK